MSKPALGPTQPPVQWVQFLSRGVRSGCGVTLTPHPLLVPWPRKSRAIPLLPLLAVRPLQSLSAYTTVHFTFNILFDVVGLCRWSGNYWHHTPSPLFWTFWIVHVLKFTRFRKLAVLLSSGKKPNVVNPLDRASLSDWAWRMQQSRLPKTRIFLNLDDGEKFKIRSLCR